MKTYTFHVSPRSGGRVWRKIEIRADQTLHQLHLAIQDAFDFDNDHLYSFFMSGKAWDQKTEYCLPEGADPWGISFEDNSSEDLPAVPPPDSSPIPGPFPDLLDDFIRRFNGADTEITDEVRQRFRDELGDLVGDVFDEPGDVLTTTLEQLDLGKGQKFLYLFDYGDEWRFTVRVHAINEDAPDGEYPSIVETVGKAPQQYPNWEVMRKNLPL